jgi:5-methylcytosine-specific restriction endonuclease McrA
MRSVRYKKKQIRKALREQVWLQYFGKCFEHKCSIIWCKNVISILNFHAGHVIPESKGGVTSIENLRPICSNCNLSMGNSYSIIDWNTLGSNETTLFSRFFVYVKYLLGY